MKFLVIILIVCFCVSPGLLQHTSRRGSRRRIENVIGQGCTTADNHYGQCLVLSACPAVSNVFNFHPHQEASEYVRTAQQSCGNRNIHGDPVVCCNTVQALQHFGNPYLPTNFNVFPAVTEPPVIWGPPPQMEIIPQPNLCTGPDLVAGFCATIQECQPLMTRLNHNPRDSALIEFLRLSNIICGQTFAVVCCPATRSEMFTVLPPIGNTYSIRLPTMEDGCGMVTSSTDDEYGDLQVVGGKRSKIGAWPWIALIGYNVGGSETPFKCGGTLISSRHVITAAHCIRSDLTFVRLGEHDLLTDMETQHFDVPVSKVLKHPDFNQATGHNDIALLYLDRDVQFSERISPICLATRPELRMKSYVNTRSFVAGWGRMTEGGQPAIILQSLRINVFDNMVCKGLYKRQKLLVTDEQFDDSVVCAGDLRGGMDTCEGDSGGPLMIPETFQGRYRYHLLGIVSYGIGCARPDTPGVYTRVSKFIEWIQEEVARTPVLQPVQQPVQQQTWGHYF